MHFFVNYYLSYKQTFECYKFGLMGKQFWSFSTGILYQTECFLSLGSSPKVPIYKLLNICK